MGRSTVDFREFVKIAVDLPDNPKLAMIDDPAAGWAYVVAICYCRQHRTDGAFPLGPLLRKAGTKKSVADKLMGVQLWHGPGHNCERCPQPLPGTAVIHDYLRHQQSGDEIDALSEARREAGRKGAASRWHNNGHGNSYSNGHGNSVPTGEDESWHLDGMPMAEVEVEEELKKKTSSSSRKKPEIHLPESWKPTDEHRRRAAAARLDLGVQVQLFKAHAEEHDRRAANWNGAFTRWLINAEEIERKRAARAPLRLASGGNPGGYRPHRGPANEDEYEQPMWPEEQR